MPLRMIFDVKVYLRRKYRLVFGGHVVDSSGHKVYEITIKSVSDRILFTITIANNLEFMTVDIVNAYLNANTQENIYTCAGADFELVGIMAEGNLLRLIKALYGLHTSGNMCHSHLWHTLREIGFRLTCFVPDVCIRGHNEG